MKHAAAIRKALIDWYRREGRDLPWRRTRDPYKIWVSEIILQQTRVDQGLPYYHRFLERFPTLQALAAANEEQVLKAWEGLGYYTRARNLHKAAKIVIEQQGGRIPQRAELLQLLPGIGAYTAGAISSTAFGEAAPVVDGNVKRSLARLYCIMDSIDLPQTDKRIWQVAGSLLDPKQPGVFNQAIIELGACVCVPIRPRCEECPVAKWCEARAAGIQEELPVRSVKKKVPHKEIVVAVIQQEGKYLLGRRPSEGLLGGLWEFPGGKVEPGESHQEALRRECAEELGIVVKAGGLVASVQHAYTHFKVTLNVYRCAIVSGAPMPKTHTELRWVAREAFAEYPFPKANHKFLDLL